MYVYIYIYVVMYIHKVWVTVFSHYTQGRLGASFIYLFVYICWSFRLVALMLCFNSIAPSTCKDDISARIGI